MKLIRFLSKQFLDVKKNGTKELLKKIKIFLIFLLISPFHILFFIVALPIVVFIRIIKPFLHIRFRTISTGRIGHFADDAGIILSETVLKQNNIKDWYWLQKPTCNHQLEKMVERAFYVRWWVKYLYTTNKIIPGGKQHTLETPSITQSARDINGLLYKSKGIKKAYLSFSEQEQADAKKYLKSIGLNDNDKFVCLNVRDSSYLNHLYPKVDWNYHNFRDSDINTYALAAVALAEKGYWVFRTGKVVSKPFNCKHPKVIDYATSDRKSDLLDIWLMANCSFSISTGSGLDSIPVIFRRPILFLNFLPINEVVTYAASLTYFKHLKWKNKNKLLNFKECLENSHYEYNEYARNGVEIIDMSPSEMKSAVLEMVDRISGKWIDKTEDIKLQNSFWHTYKKCENFRKNHSFINPSAKISSAFLHSSFKPVQFQRL